jgi:hypothetical protein
MVEAELMQNRGVQVAVVMRRIHGLVPTSSVPPWTTAALMPPPPSSTCNPWIMIAAGGVLDHGVRPEFARPNHQRFIQHPALFQS